MSTVVRPYLKPLPKVDEFNKPFFDMLKQHVFSVPRCSDCGDYGWVPYPACRSCHSTRLTWTPVSGKGEVYSYTVVYRGPGAFGEEVPYVICMGRLDERPRSCIVGANMVDVDPFEVAIGMRIKIAFEDIPAEDSTMWRWAPRGDEV